MTNACGALNTILLVRSMSHAQYGIFVVAASAMAIISAVASFGLSQTLVQLAPRVRSDGARVVMSYTLLVSAVIGAVVAVLTGIACLALGANHYEEVAVTIAIMLPIAVVSPFVASLSGFLQSVHQPKRLTKALLVTPMLLTATVVVMCATTHPAATWIAGARSGATLITLSCLVVVVHRSVRVKRLGYVPKGEDGVSFGRVLTLGSSLLSGTLTAILLAQLDVLFLGFSRGRESAAFYGPASQIADNALTLAAVVGTFYLPTIATVISKKDFHQAGDVYRWASRWTFVLVAPVICVMLACPGSVLAVLFGSDYDSMAKPLRILALGVLVNVLFGFNGITVDSLNEVKLIVGRQIIALLFNVMACAVLIPHFGATGAAVATSSSLCVMNLVASALLARHTGITPINLKLFAVACALGVSVGSGLAFLKVATSDLLRIVLIGSFTLTLCAAVSFFLSSQSERNAIEAALRRSLGRLRSNNEPRPSRSVGER